MGEISHCTGSGVGVSVTVGVGVRVGVGVDVGVEVIVGLGVIVGPNSCPVPHPDSNKQAIENTTICFSNDAFIGSPRCLGRARQQLVCAVFHVDHTSYPMPLFTIQPSRFFDNMKT